MDPSGYRVENRLGAKGGSNRSKPSRAVYWLVEVVFLVFGLRCYMKGGQDWQPSQNGLHICQRVQGPGQTVHG